MLEKLLGKEANEVYRNKDVEELKERLAILNLKCPHETVKEYCKDLLHRIDLATEEAHQVIDEFHDSLFDEVKEYEKECLEHFDSLKESGDKLLTADLKSVETVILEASFSTKSQLLKRV
jgi:polyhydroxyalkanoate synthesis regulator phasin